MSQLNPRTKSIASSVGVHELELGSYGDDADGYIDPVAERKLLRKLDLTLIPWLCLLYLISFLDRTNIGNAVIAGFL
jgi:hypothetical protein